MSAQEKIIIELDGGQHAAPENKEKDYTRDIVLTNMGYTVIRIWNNDIFNNINGVLDYILTPPENQRFSPSLKGRVNPKFVSNLKQLTN